MQPCEQKDNILKIQDKLDSRDAVLTVLQVKQAEIAGDVAHIKGRIDNGMSETLKEIHQVIIELKPKVVEYDDLYRRVKDAGWAMAYVFGGLTLGVIIWAVKSGMKI